MESPSICHDDHPIRAALQELNRGRELAKQLMRVVPGRKQPLDFDDEGGLRTVKNLATSISASFTEAISILNQSGSAAADDETSRSWASPDGRARHNNKRRKNLHTWAKLAPALADDGHAWRKYGQKDILNAQYPRNYYRCSHKYDQGCQATKQVQRTATDPPMYRIIYYGDHTCRSLSNLKPPRHQSQIILNSTDGPSSRLLSFCSNPIPNPVGAKPQSHEDDDGDLLLFPMAVAKHQSQSQSQKQRPLGARPAPPLTTSSSFSGDYFLSPDVMTLDSSAPPMTVLSSASDQGEPDVISPGVYSCTTSTDRTHNTCTDDYDHHHALDLDMDIMVGDDFGDVFLAI
uniref:Transcription factor WRKY10 n=1 Tax=Diospyros kaki TaxID=35925 RepID=A0A3Q8TA39_DIOKA|nr:transcription factor WRKY10 [Diospyros kaki]